MGNFFVIEARRLLPLLFLLVLLISLSVYDNFFRVETTVTAPEGVSDSAVAFVTADRGEIGGEAAFSLIYTREEWDALAEEIGLDLPEYPFNPEQEVALLALNSEIEDIRVLPQGEEVTQVRVKVAPRSNYYHLVSLERAQVDRDGVCWVFADDEGTILEQFSPVRDVTENGSEETEGANESEEGARQED